MTDKPVLPGRIVTLIIGVLVAIATLLIASSNPESTETNEPPESPEKPLVLERIDVGQIVTFTTTIVTEKLSLR